MIDFCVLSAAVLSYLSTNIEFHCEGCLAVGISPALLYIVKHSMLLKNECKMNVLFR